MFNKTDRINSSSVAGYNDAFPIGGSFKSQAEADAYSISWWSNPQNRLLNPQGPRIFPVVVPHLDSDSKPNLLNDKFDCSGAQHLFFFSD